MRTRKAGAYCAGLLACAIALSPAAAQARKHASPNGRHNVSINVSENPVVAGDSLVIWGRLTGPNHANRAVTLWHRINPRPRFTPVQQATTDSNGFYVFFRQKGIVNSNRNWYVRSVGSRSRTVHERVFSLVTLNGPADGSNLLTGPAHRVTFSGTVSPFAVGDRVILQRQNSDAAGNAWNQIDRTRVRPGGSFTMPHTFRVPGDANIRVLVRGTRRNLPSVSNVLSYEISQAQNPALTINASADPINVGQSVTLSGTLQNGAVQPVQLFAKTRNGSFQQVGAGLTDASGNYSFTQTPINSTIYQVHGGGKLSAQLFEGVKDVLTANVSSTTVNAGDPVTFSGTVSPDKTGHVIYLQRQNPNGNGFHTVQVAQVGTGSVYSITRRLFAPGTKVFRVFIPGGPFNQGAASQPFTITVNQVSAQQVNNSQPDQTSEG
ncbi:MAG: hypothetical protein ACJ768_11970 [Gaiellaceae bacterium]